MVTQNSTVESWSIVKSKTNQITHKKRRIHHQSLIWDRQNIFQDMESLLFFKKRIGIWKNPQSNPMHQNYRQTWLVFRMFPRTEKLQWNSTIIIPTYFAVGFVLNLLEYDKFYIPYFELQRSRNDTTFLILGDVVDDETYFKSAPYDKKIKSDNQKCFKTISEAIFFHTKTNDFILTN